MTVHPGGAAARIELAVLHGQLDPSRFRLTGVGEHVFDATIHIRDGERVEFDASRA